MVQPRVVEPEDGLDGSAREKQKEQRDKAAGKKKPKTVGKPTLGATKPSGRLVNIVPRTINQRCSR